MSRGAFFWGSVLIIFGTMVLLDNLGVVSVNLWQWVGPSFLVLLGIYVLLGPFFSLGRMENASIPLGNFSSARVKLAFGAGRLKIGAGSTAENLLEGEFGGGIERHVRTYNGGLDVKLSLPIYTWPVFWSPGQIQWNIRFNSWVPLLVELNVGAAETILDLTDLVVNELLLQTGASSTEMTLPANAGISRFIIKAGAAAVNIHVPQGVAARIRASAGLGVVSVDKARFPRQGGEYRSTDYDIAPNKVDLTIETGLGSVDIR